MTSITDAQVKLHLLGVHPSSDPRLGLEDLERAYQEPYGAYTLGLFYAGEFGQMKRYTRAKAWYAYALELGFHAASEQLEKITSYSPTNEDKEDEEWELEK